MSSAVFERAREQGVFDYDKYTSPEEILFPSCHMDMNYLKLRFALACGEVTSTQGVYIHQILNIMSYLEQNWEPLVNDIEKGTIRDGIALPEDIRAKLERRITPMPERAAQLRKEFEAGFDKPIAPRIWKKLCFVMAISGSVFEPYMKKLRRYIGDTPYHYFIYAASEGFFGTAYEINSDTYILAPRAGFYEFLPLDDEEETEGIMKAVDASQVKQGEKYELVYTGFSGLYRYRMGDVLEVIGFHKKAPLVKFRYRRKQCVNVAGEKMDIQSIVQAVEIFAEQYHIHVQEFSVYQDMDCMPGRYVFFIETPSKVEAGDYDKASEMLDRLLCRQSMDYEDCRDLGEIGAETGQYKPIRLLDTQARYSFFMARAKRFQEELEH